MTPLRRLPLSQAEADEVHAGQFVRVDLDRPAPLPDGLRCMSVLIGKASGKLVAYANRCQHNPVPLDAGDYRALPSGVGRAPMTDEGTHFMCASHGAVYRPDDGVCILGPCFGQRLFPVGVEVQADEPQITLVLRDG